MVEAVGHLSNLIPIMDWQAVPVIPVRYFLGQTSYLRERKEQTL